MQEVIIDEPFVFDGSAVSRVALPNCHSVKGPSMRGMKGSRH